MKKKTFAWIRVGAAVVAAIVLLAVTGFGFADLLGGAVGITDGAQLQDGMYVEADLTYIMSFCGVEKNAAGEETAYYAVAPIGDKFVLVRFDASEHDKAASLEDATEQYLMGESDTLPFHLTVTGTAKTIGQEQGELMAQWFNDNGEWMLSAGVITQVDNFGDYLWTVQLNAGMVNGMKANTVAVLSVAALVLALYAVAELVAVGCGVYDKKSGKAKKVKKEKKTVSETADSAPLPAEEEVQETVVTVPEAMPAPVTEEAPETEMPVASAESAVKEDTSETAENPEDGNV